MTEVGAPRARLAQPADIPALHALDAWPNEATWRKVIANEEVVVLEQAGRLIGLARYSVLWTTVPFLGLIFLDEAHRGRGYSRLLLGFLLAELRAKGYVALLSSSQTDEPEPQAWHLHMGFAPNGVIENIADEGVGELVYRLML